MTRLLFLLWLCASFACAEEQQFAFALPDLEGRISLGVFDLKGKLVRTLKVNATENEFKVGLNGLITTWDGKDHDGQSMPAGKYRIRGYVVGDQVKAEGVAYHFNDWVEDETSPRIVRIEDMQKLSDGLIILAAGLEGESRVLLRYDFEKGFVWRHLLRLGIREFEAAQHVWPHGLSLAEDTGGMVAVAGSRVVVVAEGKILVVKLENGEVVTDKANDLKVAALAATDDSAFVTTWNGLAVLNFSGLTPGNWEATPTSFHALAARPGQKLGANPKEAAVWLQSGEGWKKLETGAYAGSVSFGWDKTFWLAGVDAESGGNVAGQFSETGEFLRAYTGDLPARKVSAVADKEEVVVLEADDASQRLCMLRQAGEEWQTAFEKTIQACSRFGLVNGELVADAGDTPQSHSVSLTVAGSGLSSSKHQIEVKVKSTPHGLWLETKAGLRLSRLSELPGGARTIVAAGPEKHSLKVFAGDGAVVAEYLLTGLNKIAEIEAGEIELAGP